MDSPNVAGVEFRSVEGFPKYVVGSDGNVWSRHYGRWNLLKGCSSGEYRDITLCDGGRQIRKKIHHIVLEAFVGPCPPGLECRHKDGNRNNNSTGNIEWATHVENCADRVLHGTSPRCEKGGSSKLKIADVREILRLRDEGKQLKDIAAQFPQVTKGNVWAVMRGKSWKYLPQIAS